MYLSERPQRDLDDAGDLDTDAREGDATASSVSQGSGASDASGPAPRTRTLRTKVAPTVIALGMTSLFTDISSESLQAVLPLFLVTIGGFSYLSYAVIDALYQGVSALTRIFGGWMADRADRPKWVAFLGYGVSAISKVGLLAFSGVGAVSAIITVDRLGKGFRTGPRDALIAGSTPTAQLGRAFGVHRAMDTAGAAIGPLLAAVILWLVPNDYSSVFVASFAAAMIGLAVLFLFVPDLRPRRQAADAAVAAARASAARDATQDAGQGPAAPTAAAEPVRPSLRAMRDSGMARLVVATALLSVLAVSDAFLYLSLQERDDLRPQWYALLFVGTNIAYTAFAVPLGRLSDRVGRAKVLVAGHLLLVGAYAFAALPRGGAVSIVACLLLLGAFYAATDGVLAALTSTLVPLRLRAVGIATTGTVTAVGRLVCSLVFGALWVGIGRQQAVWIYAVLLLCAIPVAGWLLAGIRRTAAPDEATA